MQSVVLDIAASCAALLAYLAVIIWSDLPRVL
jgi:hypothetical protein